MRERRWATFDDLTFLPCSLTRIPLEGYREKCSTKTVLGTRFARKPIELDIPVMITGMSWGALSYNAKVALARGARTAGSSNTTGDGGMLMAERENSRTLIYEVLPSRYGINIHHMRMADAIELTIGQGAKPGTGGLLLGSKISDVIAKQRDLPVGVDQRSPARHPDFLGPDDMIIKVEELREATDGQVPIFIKMGASRVFDDVKLAAKAGADVIVVDGMEGGTGASPAILQEHTGIPTLAAVCEARAALEDIGLYGEVQLIIAGGLRDGVDAAKAILFQGELCPLINHCLLCARSQTVPTAASTSTSRKTGSARRCNRPIGVEFIHLPLNDLARQLSDKELRQLPNRLGLAIRDLRSRRGISQEKLARAAGGMGRSHLSRIECGHVHPPLSTLLRLTGVLGLNAIILRFENAKLPSSSPTSHRS